MNAAAWAACVLLAAGLFGLSFWLYTRREPPGRGRLLLAALRGLALALVLLLLFDPVLPGRARSEPGRAPRVLLDASASMGLPERPAGTGSRWQAGVREARRHARGRPVLLFGAAPRPLRADSLPGQAPGDAGSQLLPALRAAAEAGAREVVVVTDGGLEDVASVPAWLARLGLEVRWVRVGEPLPGAGLLEVRAPAWAQAGTPVSLEVTLGSSGGPAGERRLVVRQDGRVIAEGPVRTPEAGRLARAAIPVRPAAPAQGGPVRLELALEPGDALAADDRRAVVLEVSAEPAGIVLVSGQPDWEPRFLLPSLERALGLPARGFLQVAPGRWVRLGDGAAAGVQVPEGDVLRAVTRADLLVLHALPESPTPWLVEALQTAPRLLVLPVRATAAAPVPLPDPVAGDWYLSESVPSSPIAALLTDLPVGDAPPLAALSPIVLPGGAWSALDARRAAAGAPVPALVAGSAAGRRWAVAPGQGYWRWAFRGGRSREVYDRLWSAAGGWLLGEASGPGQAGVRMVAAVVPSGTAGRWVAAGFQPDSIRLRAEGPDGAVLDTLLRGAGAAPLAAPVLAPGAWTWRATAWGEGSTASGAGELFVEAFAPELVRPAADLEDMGAARSIEPELRRGAPVPLHTLALPWILIVLLLAAEWLLRRRWGLR